MKAGILDLFDKVTVLETFARTLEKTTLESSQLYLEENRVEITLSSPILLDRSELLQYRDAVMAFYHLRALDIRLRYRGVSPDAAYFQGLLDGFLKENVACRICLQKAEISFLDGVLTVCRIRGGEELLKARRFSDYLAETVREECGISVVVELSFEELDVEKYLKEQEKQQKAISAKAAAQHGVSAAPKTGAVSAPSSGLLFGKHIPPEDVISIIDLSAGMTNEAVEGEVLTLDVRDIKRNGKEIGKTAIDFNLGDRNWGCFCSLFGQSDRLAKAKAALSVGSRVRVRGSFALDDFSHKPTLKVNALELLEPLPKRQDLAETKRVELHLHTKMSAMDAVSSAEDLIQRAADWGHPAIAITDHGVAQAFPEAHKIAAKLAKSGKEIKVLYGMEGYLLNDTPSTAAKLAARGEKGTYVVFDIETTGLSPFSEEITEIGAVKLVDGVKTETFSQLINPEIPIPQKITELTGITDAMVADKPAIDAVLPAFLEFCKGATVVAHNAGFDTGFIRQKALRMGLSFHNPIVDTLALSRELFPDEKKHRLNIVAERLGVSLENHHRAVDDATATAEIFLKFLDLLAEKYQGAKETDISKNPALLKGPRQHIILLAQNYDGLKNLYRLISSANLQYFHRRPLLPRSVIEKHRDGLLLGSACEAGELYQAVLAGKPDSVLEEIALFYDYLEIQPLANDFFMLRNGAVRDEEALREINRKIVGLGEKLGMPVAATCDVHFMDPEDEVYRRVLLGAQEFPDADQQAPLYLRTTEEMLEEFSYLGEEKAYEVVVTNTRRIADLCQKIQPVKDGSYPPSIENCEEDLVAMCHQKAHKIYGDPLPDIVKARMDKELDCITKYGYAVMYMIAHKLVKKSNEAGYLVGSRGSVGSSFAAFLADITEVNALCPHYICPNPDCKHSEFFENGEYAVGPDMPDKDCPVCGTRLKKDGLTIPFETFLGFKGDKVPDIDLNFSGEYQATAHKYVGELFGDEYVFKAGTIGTIADKTAFGFAKKYYELKGIEAPEAELIRVSRGMIDVKRTTGQHPGGIIVCPKTMNIHDFCPIQHPADKKDSDIITTHFDFHSIHDNLLKLDILGHDDPSTIRMLEDLTGVNAMEIPLDDKTVMSLFSSTEALGVTPEQIGSEVGTFGVPEFGTSFVRGMLMETKPSTFMELLVISGLSHGTDVWLNNAQDLIRAKKATLSEVIGLRDDIMVFLMQHGLEPSMAFQIMEIVRKGLAAKGMLTKEMEDAVKNGEGIPDWYLDSCKTIKYMFPKAHAAAYVMMAFRIAWFKVNYPLEFYISYLTVRADLFDAATMAQGVETVRKEMQLLSMKQTMSATEKETYTILEICLEMYERGITFLPIDLYRSHARKFQRVGDAILPPLNAFAGVGDAAAEALMKAAAEGPFLSQEDIKNRAGINKSVLETLAENGVLKGIPESSQIGFLDMMQP